ILKNFDEGGALVNGGVLQCVLQMRLEDVHGACDKGRFSANGQRDGIEWPIDGAKRRRFSLLIELGGGRVLTFRQAVDAVIEEENFEPDFAPQHMNSVIPADGKGIAVSGGDPYFQVR